MSESTPLRRFGVDVVATACADAAALRRWISGGAARRCAGASPAAVTIRERLRVAAPDATTAERVACRALLDSALSAGMAVGAVQAHARLAPGAQPSPSRHDSSSASLPRS